MNTAILTAACSFAILTAPLPNNESRIRCVASNTAVVGPLQGKLRFTSTGYLSDQVFIWNGLGIPVVQGTIGQLRTHANVRKVVNHSGGQTSLRFQFINSPGLDNGEVYIVRGNQVIDQDPINLH